MALAVFAGQSSAEADNVDGAWSALEDWPLIAIHAAITPDGRVLSYGTNPDGKQTGNFWYDVWDPTRNFLSATSSSATDVESSYIDA